MIRCLAKSLSGSEHILNGRIVDKQSAPWRTVEDVRSHLETTGWTDCRVEVDRKVNKGVVRTVWDAQSVTEHIEGSGEFKYLKGGPITGQKISKSKIAEGS